MIYGLMFPSEALLLFFFFLSQSLHFTNDLAILLEYQVAELLKPVFLPVSEKACVYVSSFVFFF